MTSRYLIKLLWVFIALCGFFVASVWQQNQTLARQTELLQASTQSNPLKIADLKLELFRCQQELRHQTAFGRSLQLYFDTFKSEHRE